MKPRPGLKIVLDFNEDDDAERLWNTDGVLLTVRGKFEVHGEPSYANEFTARKLIPARDIKRYADDIEALRESYMLTMANDVIASIRKVAFGKQA